MCFEYFIILPSSAFKRIEKSSSSEINIKSKGNDGKTNHVFVVHQSKYWEYWASAGYYASQI